MLLAKEPERKPLMLYKVYKKLPAKCREWLIRSYHFIKKMPYRLLNLPFRVGEYFFARHHLTLGVYYFKTMVFFADLLLPKNTNIYKKIQRLYGWCRFLKQTEEILDRVPQPHTPKAVVFIVIFKCFHTIAMITPIICKLRQQGYAVVCLTQGTLKERKTGISAIDRFHGIISYTRQHLKGENIKQKELRHEWNIDWNNKVVSAEGINFYQPMFERLSRTFRRYTLNIGNPDINKQFQGVLYQADAMLAACEEIYKAQQKIGLPFRILSSNSHFMPYAPFRIFCHEKGRENDIHFINVVSSYQNYYSNLSTKYSTAISLEDMTKHDKLRTPFLALREKFERWLVDNPLTEEMEKEVDGWINHNRTNKKLLVPPAEEVLEQIKSHKQAGRNVACLFGKIVYDQAVPYERGPAHKDMQDWLNHTIACAKNSDALFLVKPHPHELRQEIAEIPNEYFLDLISEDLPKNVIILEHNWFNLFELLPLLDAGIMWNGSSSLELGAAGVPVIMCSDWGINDYPVDVVAPNDRDHYQDILKHIDGLNVKEDNAKRCKSLIKYMSTDELMIPYNYAKRPGTNEDIGSPEWYMEEIDTFFTQGDPYIDYLAGKFFQVEEQERSEQISSGSEKLISSA